MWNAAAASCGDGTGLTNDSASGSRATVPIWSASDHRRETEQRLEQRPTLCLAAQPPLGARDGGAREQHDRRVEPARRDVLRLEDRQEVQEPPRRERVEAAEDEGEHDEPRPLERPLARPAARDEAATRPTSAGQPR